MNVSTNTHRSLINMLGGASKLARAVNVTLQRVWMWHYRNSIPPYEWKKIIDVFPDKVSLETLSEAYRFHKD